MSEAPIEPSMKVTMRDLYVLLQAQGQKLSDLTAEVRLINQRDVTTERLHQDLEGRVRLLEKRVWAIPSLAAIVSVLGLAISLIPVIR